MSETRQTFANLAHWEIVSWYCLSAISTQAIALMPGGRARTKRGKPASVSTSARATAPSSPSRAAAAICSGELEPSPSDQ